MIRRTLTTGLGTVALAGILAACGGGQSSGPASEPAAATEVKVISDPTTIGAYTPMQATAKAGDVVKWTFADANPHTVTADDSSFHSNTLAGGKTYTHKFEKAGTYAYHCGIHPEMHGTITIS